MDEEIRFRITAYDSNNRLLNDMRFKAVDENEINIKVDDITEFMLDTYENAQAGEYS